MTNHEHHPDRHDPKRPGPEREYLQPGEIDFTGAVPQRQDMLDLIGDAFTEAKATGGEIPDWGARAIARILADGLEPGSALHQFAVTGRADPDAISAETIPIYTAPDTPAEVKRWIDYLGTYLLHQDDQPESAARVSTTHRPADPDITVSIYHLSDNESANTAIRRAIALAKDTGGTIHPWIAYAIARHLADQLPDQASALSTFADNSTIDAPRLTAETRAIARADTTPDEIREWISFFDAFVASRTAATPDRPTADEPTEAALPSQAEQGIREFGDAFRAYLALEDIDPAREDLIQTFHEVYVGRYRTMDAVVGALTEVTEWQAAVDELSTRLGIDGLVAIDHSAVDRLVRERWDVNEVDGVLYVFEK